MALLRREKKLLLLAEMPGTKTLIPVLFFNFHMLHQKWHWVFLNFHIQFGLGIRPITVFGLWYMAGAELMLRLVYNW
jgi:hypothetical protein